MPSHLLPALGASAVPCSGRCLGPPENTEQSPGLSAAVKSSGVKGNEALFCASPAHVDAISLGWGGAESPVKGNSEFLTGSVGLEGCP